VDIEEIAVVHDLCSEVFGDPEVQNWYPQDNGGKSCGGLMP